MLLRENASDEKLRGSYYTQYELANYIVNWTTSDKCLNINRILEPSCGDGIFLRCLEEKNLQKECEIIAIEINKNASKLASKRINDTRLFNSFEEFNNYTINNDIDRNLGCTVINDDFYNVYESKLKQEKFQSIIGNPPYIRYQYLSDIQRKEQSLILTSNGMKPNKLINAWVSFVVSCLEMMDGNSKIALVLPAELLQVAYAEDLRKFLVKSLQKITIVTFRELIFEGVEQEVVLLLGEKDLSHNGNNKLRIVQYKDVNQLVERDDLDKYEFVDAEINESKWTKYFLSANDIDLINKVRLNNKFIRFNDVAKVEVGITTGNNAYFCADRQLIQNYNLEDIGIPLIARSVNVNGILFTKQDWQENINRGAKTYLINFPDMPYESYSMNYKKYIEYGEINNQNKGYKCRIRDRWYKVPSIWVPDAFFLRRNYLYPKFILNSEEVNAVSTDTMHRVRFKKKEDNKRVILSYYNSIGLAFTEIEGRSYGGGVLEILPGEVSKIMVPDLRDEQLIDNNDVDELINKLDKYVRNNDDILGILDEIDKKILIEIVGIDEEVVFAFRQMWLRLRERRISRGRRQINKK